MLTQINIKPDLCIPEFIKIASHSFGFATKASLNPNTVATCGSSNIQGVASATWSNVVYNVFDSYSGGIMPYIKYGEVGGGIALPTNLVAEDVVTLTGTAYFDLTAFTTLKGANYAPHILIGVYYFNCDEAIGSSVPTYNFIPITTERFNNIATACFSANVTLGGNFDLHKTRFVVAAQVYSTSDGGGDPLPSVNAPCTVSYSLNVERACKSVIDNFIIKNCCEPAITELVHIPGLVVGNFHVDDEGNCWEVISESLDVTNFTRNFVDIYASCEECQTAHPCPLNLTISSCCVSGTEFVSGSLPGLDVGDTFVDNYGLCWNVQSTTGAPISEESITVDTIISGNCETCKAANPCPYFYYIVSCCGSLEGIVALPNLLALNNTFSDTNGICWRVEKINMTSLPTIYGIEVATVYGDCASCVSAHPCPTEYFVTIRACCDPDRIEVASIPDNYMYLSEGVIFSDYWGVCWEVMSFSTTGVETYPIWNWSSPVKPSILKFETCLSCREFQKGCILPYQVKNCRTNVIEVIASKKIVNIGSFYYDARSEDCYEILGYGYPPFSNIQNTNFGTAEFEDCTDCILNNKTKKTVILQPCCGGPNVIANSGDVFINGIGGVYLMKIYPPVSEIYQACFTLVGLSTAATTTDCILEGNFTSCTPCFVKAPCS